MKDHQFRKLVVWQRAMLYTTRIYKLSSVFPKTEQFGLTDQLRRAAVSIALNIAEGSGSGTNQEFMRFLVIAKRSAYEVITALEIARNLRYSTDNQIAELIVEAQEICSMIVGLSRNLRS